MRCGAVTIVFFRLYILVVYSRTRAIRAVSLFLPSFVSVVFSACATGRMVGSARGDVDERQSTTNAGVGDDAGENCSRVVDGGGGIHGRSQLPDMALARAMIDIALVCFRPYYINHATVHCSSCFAATCRATPVPCSAYHVDQISRSNARVEIFTSILNFESEAVPISVDRRGEIIQRIFARLAFVVFAVH